MSYSLREDIYNIYNLLKSIKMYKALKFNRKGQTFSRKMGCQWDQAFYGKDVHMPLKL